MPAADDETDRRSDVGFPLLEPPAPQLAPPSPLLRRLWGGAAARAPSFRSSVLTDDTELDSFGEFARPRRETGSTADAATAAVADGDDAGSSLDLDATLPSSASMEPSAPPQPDLTSRASFQSDPTGRRGSILRECASIELGPPKSQHSRKLSLGRLSTFYTSSHASLDGRGREEIYEVQWNRTEENSMLTQERKYPSNYVRTTKYTLWTFVPVNLFHQFRRFYNLYFLLAAIFVLTEPSLNPTTEIMPLCIVLLITAIKDAHEDYKRYKQDKDANSSMHQVVRDGETQSILSQDIMPGDILRLEKGERIPADVVVLSTSIAEGVCYVDTMNLDGETSLKRRTAVPYSQPHNSAKALMNVSGCIECELPNERLNVFEGLVTMDSSDRPREVLPLTLDNLLLRGTYLRNTEHVYAVVLYTGTETKIYKNLKETGLKFSTHESRLNKMILLIFVYNAVLLALSLSKEYVATEEQRNRSSPRAWYLGKATIATSRVISGSFMTFFVLYTFLIPISVFVSMEIVRLIQARFMIWDDRMKSSDGRRMKVHNTNLHEDLGCIEYLLSDKTGTLTQNLMRLSKWCIAGVEYDQVAQPDILRKQITTLPVVAREKIENFCRCVALCHTAIPVNGQYESPSPDESALLEAMRGNDVLLLNRTKESITISILGQTETFDVLHVLDFNSDRKRMSVIVRNSGGIFLFCKGADSVITARLHDEDSKSEELQVVEAKVTSFAVNGLRTLMMAWRRIPTEEYEKFARRYQKAERALTKREARVAKACETIEVNLRLLGCSAIEDRLQAEVPETIEYLLACGIRIWLLTGDKQETAIKIGMSSSLIHAGMNIMRLNVKSAPECSELLDDFLLQVSNSSCDDNALVVDGASLVYVLLLPEVMAKFLDVGVKCRSVICCRVTPLQKALVVRMIKKQLKKVTLSIGDGANDVSMIQEAHVGVGIEGMEGAQAVRASDYSFVEFRALRHLLAIHGRYSILRMSGLVFYSFYKSIALITVQCWFGFMNAWSGEALYFDVFLTLWNLIFTCVAPIVMASFDKDVDEDRLAKYPQLYEAVAKGKFWNLRIELSWLAAALVHSVVMFGALVLIFGHEVLNVEGYGSDVSVQAFTACTLVLMTVTVKFCLTNRLWVWPTTVAVFGSVLVYVLTMLALEGVGLLEDGVFGMTHRTPAYYFVILLVPLACNLPDLVSKYLRRNYYPDDAMIVKELPMPTSEV